MNLLRRLLTPLIFANHAAVESGEIGFTNQITLTDAKAPEWVEIPFGHHDHKNGMQLFDRESAEKIVANFNSLLGERTFGGLPWYIGHPDVAEFANTYKDKSARGWVKEMQVAESGLRLRVKWNAAGEQVIANEEFKYFSPTWGVVAVPGQSRTYRPVRMKSVGFTNEPNIGVLPLSNANETQTTNTNMEFLKKLAELLGLDPETATEEQCANCISEMKGKMNANEKPPGFLVKLGADGATEILLVNEADAPHITALLEAKGALEASIVATKTALKEAETAFANERKERGELLIANAIREGRITAAQREAWANELAADFDTKSAELGALKPAIHTGGHTKNLGPRKEVSDAAAKVVELANERMTKNGDHDWDRAWKETLKEQPALAEQLKQKPANG